MRVGRGFSGIGNADRLKRHKVGGRTMAHVADHLSVLALEQQYRSCTDVTAARHFQTIWLLAKGHDLAPGLGHGSYARRWVERLLARYNAGGPQALGDLRRRNGASSSVLKPDLLEKLKVRLLEPPPDGRLWTSPKVAGLVASELGLAEVFAPTRLGGAQGDRLVGMGAPPPPPGLGHARGAGGVQKKLEQAVAEARAQRPQLSHTVTMFPAPLELGMHSEVTIPEPSVAALLVARSVS